ncbi:GntR family transcriptional regulator [Salinifilum aidingensis]
MVHSMASAARSTRGFVVDSLREAIVEGRLPAGSRLGQDQLRAEFATSAAPVREALRQLESEGLVVHYPNRGSFVTEVDAHELRGVLLPVRLQLEQHAARHAIAHAATAFWDGLAEIVHAMRSAADHGDLRAVTETDVRFHRTLISEAHSVHATHIWSGIESRIRMQFHILGRPQHRLHSIAEEHEQLLDELRSGDRSRADDALREHIVDAAEQLLDKPPNDTAP